MMMGDRSSHNSTTPAADVVEMFLSTTGYEQINTDCMAIAAIHYSNYYYLSLFSPQFKKILHQQ